MNCLCFSGTNVRVDRLEGVQQILDEFLFNMNHVDAVLKTLEEKVSSNVIPVGSVAVNDRRQADKLEVKDGPLNIIHLIQLIAT